MGRSLLGTFLCIKFMPQYTKNRGKKKERMSYGTNRPPIQDDVLLNFAICLNSPFSEHKLEKERRQKGMKIRSSPWHAFVCLQRIPFSGNRKIYLLGLRAAVMIPNCHLVFRLLLSAPIWNLKGLYISFSVQSLKQHDLSLFEKVRA